MRAAQQDKGWNDGEMATRAGVHRNTVRDLKRLKGKPQTKTVRALARVLDIPVREAMELAGLDPETAVESEVVAVGEATPNSGPGMEPEPGSRLESRLEAVLAALPPRDQARLKRLRAEEWERYEKQRHLARQSYEQSLSRIEEIAKYEIERTRKSSDDGDDKKGEN